MTARGPEPSGTLQVAIIGAGLSGLCLAIKLRQAGVSSFALFEKSDGVGGTWRDNTYPAAACDVPSHLYSFSFERKRDWSRKYAGQAEILAYAEALVRAWGLAPHLRLGTDLAAARFDAGANLWRLRTRSGEEIAAQALVSACGQLNRPRTPEIPGRDAFAGRQFHSARWQRGLDFAGLRVAVIGNGASAVQLIPEIAARADRLHVFQRSANWIIPRGDRDYADWERWTFARLPLAERLYRYRVYWSLESRFVAFAQGSRFGKLAEGVARRYLQRQVADPALRRKLEPDYPIGCKRILISDDYYQALQRPNVELVTAPIERLTAKSVITADGAARPVDAVIYATGFEATSFLAPLELTGNADLPIGRAWGNGAEAHLGIAVPGFPNFFMMYGPNTNLGHNSIIFMIECQAAYIMGCLRPLLAGEIAALEVTPAAMARFRTRLDRDLARTVWAAGCRSWYKTADGKITNNWSGFTVAYWWRTRRPDFADFRTG
jgi:cation diffusion facilitator CzcD-associated flavoprotein CzcO